MRCTLTIAAGLILLIGCSSAATTQAPESEPEADSPLEMAATYSAERAGDAVLVWKDGSLVLERYQNGYDGAEPHFLASGTKTFSGAMALAAVEDGLFALDDPVAQYITEWQDDPEKAQITIRQLLHLTGGLDAEIGQAPSFDESVQAPLVHAPGEGFRYEPTAFQVFGALLQRVLDGEDPAAYLQRRVLAPIDAEVAHWNRVDGDPQLAGGATLTARNWLRFGRLLLNDGRWNGKSVIDSALMSELIAPTDSSPGYGLSVWLNAAVDTSDAFFEGTPASVHPDGPEGMIYHSGPPDLYMAAGLFNQRLYVVPSEQMVVVRFGRTDTAWSDAEFLARLLDGEAYDAPPRPQLSSAERIDLLTRLRIRQLDRLLTLSDEQEDAIRPLVRQQMEGLATLEDGSDMSRRARRRMLRTLRQIQQETDRAIQSELTSEQATAYQDFRAEERAERLEQWRERR